MTTYAARNLHATTWAAYAISADGTETILVEGDEIAARAEVTRRTEGAAKPKTRTITLTDRAPVKIIETAWPEIASANDWDNTHESQANRRWQLRVRQNRLDGRTIVYGTYSTHFQGERGMAAGELLDPPADAKIDPEHWLVWDEIVAAIKRVAANCGCEAIADECIADLPAQEI